MERTEQLAQLLQEALEIAEEAHDPLLLRHLYDARVSLREWASTNVDVRVDLLAGRVFARGLPVPLSPSECAIIMALALHERGVPRDILAEDLYPESRPKSAANAVKVYVYRVRRRVGSADVIHYDEGRYVLGNSVDVELPRIEAEIRRLRLCGEQLTCDFRRRLERFHARLIDGRPQFMLDWDWFEETERRLRDLTRDLAIFLAHDALRNDHYERAIALAGDLTREDSLDEVAPEIAIRAFLLAGNRAAAILEYRRYASVLEREIASRPSEDLRALIDDQLQPSWASSPRIRTSRAREWAAP